MAFGGLGCLIFEDIEHATTNTASTPSE